MKLAVVALVALLLGFLAVRHQQAEAAERRLATIAGEIAGRAVHVECQGALAALFDVTAEAGSVQFDAHGRPTDTARLKRRTCSDLARFRRDPHSAELACLWRGAPCPEEVIRTAWSVQALAHEAWHLAGELDEARTECFGIQTTARVAERLGAEPTHAQALAAYLYAHVYPRLPSNYRTGDCRDGGPLDLRPESAVWP
jgi:hypothetical protein